MGCYVSTLVIKKCNNNYDFNYCCTVMSSGCCIFTYIDRELSRNTHIIFKKHHNYVETNCQETHTIMYKHINYVETRKIIKKHTQLRRNTQLCRNTHNYAETHTIM